MVASIASLITGDLRRPIIRVRLHLPTPVDAIRTPMPETTVDEYTGPTGWKHYVGTPWQIAAVHPVSQPSGMKVSPHGHLRRRILASNPGHDLTAALYRHCIHDAANGGRRVRRSQRFHSH